MRTNKIGQVAKFPAPLTVENPNQHCDVTGILEGDNANLVGHNVTINKADYSQATGKVVKVSEQKITLDLTKGVKGAETNVWLTIEDENKKEHTGTLFLN
jgi:hypothetical protein